MNHHFCPCVCVLQDDKRRVGVVMLPYSELDSLPKVIPDHLKNRSLSLPKDMNAILCEIHRIKNKSIFPCLPFPFIQPEVRENGRQHIHLFCSIN